MKEITKFDRYRLISMYPGFASMVKLPSSQMSPYLKTSARTQTEIGGTNGTNRRGHLVYRGPWVRSARALAVPDPGGVLRFPQGHMPIPGELDVELSTKYIGKLVQMGKLVVVLGK